MPFSKSKALKLERNSYLVERGFHSNLAYHFGISTIPRYLLFDRDGKLISSDVPRPSKKDQLDQILNKVVSSGN
jgi:hypothetical protein